MTEEGGEQNRPEEYSVGPLDHSTWLTIYAAVSRAIMNEDCEELADEYEEAKDKFLAAHPDEATRDPSEYWSDGMKEAWNEMVTEEIRDV